ncbi:hypothetical protein BC937DRAFT_88036 [Endogone sp. FLAS-F59071]|nr:hypothetical protein BC937DRAFT_88036 [Endogone sp. FLAS-F59071]|eukprot:RUS19057.1 hypothetical protein BC937DRAFT_88036 [Endogone sp. FLAS-F59071]
MDDTNALIVAAFIRTHLWVKDSDGHVPPDAVPVGQYFVGRAKYKGRTIFGKVHPSHGVLYYPWNGQEPHSTNYEVLITTPGTIASWIPAGPNGTLPTGLPAGSFVLGDEREDSWVAATTWSDGQDIPGKYIRGHGNAYIPHDSRENRVANFNFLVLHQEPMPNYEAISTPSTDADLTIGIAPPFAEAVARLNSLVDALLIPSISTDQRLAAFSSAAEQVASSLSRAASESQRLVGKLSTEVAEIVIAQKHSNDKLKETMSLLAQWRAKVARLKSESDRMEQEQREVVNNLRVAENRLGSLRRI